MADYYSKERYDEMVKELEHLKTKGRADMARQISEARDKGDLSENAEYDAAKEAQGLLEKEIAELENAMANARVFKEGGDIDNSKALIFSKVRVMNHKFKKEFTYTLVSPKEADIAKSKISTESPIGEGLMGKAVGDIVEIAVPSGSMKLEILEISR